MTASGVVFIILAVCILASATAVVLLRSPLKAALSLVVCFVFLAGMYVLLLAHFLAAMQVLIYAGAVMVLFIFVVMLLNPSPSQLRSGKMTVAKFVGVMAVLFIVGKAAKTVLSAAPFQAQALPLGEPTFGSIERVGDKLFSQFMFPFELISMLLLVAIVASVVIAKKSFWRENR